MNDLYLVPFDFTPITQRALEYAIRLTRTRQDRIMLLHIVKSESKIEEAEKELAKVLEAPQMAKGSVLRIKQLLGMFSKTLAKLVISPKLLPLLWERMEQWDFKNFSEVMH